MQKKIFIFHAAKKIYFNQKWLKIDVLSSFNMRNDKYRGENIKYGVKNIKIIILNSINKKFQGLKNVNSNWIYQKNEVAYSFLD